MAYRIDLLGAARRHFRSGSELYGLASAGAQPGCKAVAGYLFGLSGELAVKAMMRDSGMTPLSGQAWRDDPYYAHFPRLKELLKDMASGRRQGQFDLVPEKRTP